MSNLSFVTATRRWWRGGRALRDASLVAGLVATGAAGLSGCASMNKKEKGAVIGGAVGGAVGAAVGRANGSTAKGAILGAVVGGAAGAIIGHQMDQQAKEIKQSVPGAVVERVGEGIQVTFESGLLFDFDSDRLRDSAKANLRSLAQSLDKFPNTDIVIVGHTDSVGTDAYNQALSDRRAQAARAYLISQGVPASRIRAYGRGETEPVASNATAAGRQENRRVEVAIFADSTARAQAQKQASGE